MSASSRSTRGLVRVGISGWTYAPWRGVFYPPGLKQSSELPYAAETFPSIEINGTFYGLQKPTAFRAWRDATPDDFVFAVKGSRYITHLKRLKDIETPLANFLASGLLALGSKLGPILWQFPPHFRYDRDRLEPFLAMLPKDTKAAAAFAARHDTRVEGRCVTETDRKRPLRHAVEIRHESFRDPDFVALLKAYNVALVFADTVEWPYFEDVTADFVYARLHGSQELYASGYSDDALDRWAARFRAWSEGGEPDDADRIGGPARRQRGRDCYVYFDNDMKVRAPFDALSLAAKLGLALAAPDASRPGRSPHPGATRRPSPSRGG
ncbi:DUF72 domain-containing protein [Segnochrobactrum spirostomi]|uniref:DUF72 domain-containing protein n=1 Tax=Segnochrobactrum spirostomi TaxID=2608987 RepID=A0A6A7XYD6_9HYPH|nr:DUF72 domain-containing protein [Segnochrobactrum spirostomi]MQT11348.1 DUF72 domain-containing protein [Segnochrobactrum spirostomi]